MQNTSRKRGVSSCIPCYTKKQKCSRRYPCNHCTRRRRPEECIYYPSQATNITSPSPQTEDVHLAGETQHQTHSSNNPQPSLTGENARECTHNRDASLAELFGYYEDSESNTLALIQALGLNEGENQDGKDSVIPLDIFSVVQQDIERMPDRRILDFLIQYYVAEVNWMDQLVHPPCFLSQYQRWWAKGPLSSVEDVEFAILLLRMCSYASQFLPSPSYTIDTIRGMCLTDIRSACDDIGDTLAAICRRLDARGSLLRVQHLAFTGLRSQCEGKTNAFWETLNCAIRVAQWVGIDRDSSISTHGGMHELENEMRRRTFCNLYIWDSSLSRQLDRIPFLPDSLGTERLPRMHLGPDIDNEDAPESFTERILEAHLATFWRSFGPRQGTEYDLTVAEERYEKFCREFINMLPPAFALPPNKEWDDRLPILPLQRQLLHMKIFDSVCWNFRPALLIQPHHIIGLPQYKRVLLSSQKRALALAALSVLEAVSALHAMLGASHTRFSGIIFHTFEAAVLLVCLCLDLDFPDDGGDRRHSSSSIADPLDGGAIVTRDLCIQAAGDALSRLRMLADVSNMAEAGARTLDRILGRATGVVMAHTSGARTPGEPSYAQLPKPGVNIAQWPSFEQDTSPLGELLSATASEDSYSNWEMLAIEFEQPLANM